MKLKELKEIIDKVIMRQGNEELEVVIPNNKPSMGRLSTTKIRGANQGIDWNKEMFILWTEKRMVDEMIDGKTEEKTYTETDMKEFAEWCSRKGWGYSYKDKEWSNMRPVYQIKTTAQLRELWKKERGEGK